MEKSYKDWNRPARWIQANLQIDNILQLEEDPERLAEQVLELGGNGLVINVGGIYAWYPTKVPYHTRNPMMAEDSTMLSRLIEACHARDIAVIARFDFSKTEDVTFLKKPQWFTRMEDKKPHVTAGDRMGDWSLLLTTCLNGGYQNEEVAMPVVEEVLDLFDIDAIFICSFCYARCTCESCRKKYRRLYGKEIPTDAESYEPGWIQTCLDDSKKKMAELVRRKRPDVQFLTPYILWNTVWEKGDLFRTRRIVFPNPEENPDIRNNPEFGIYTEPHDALASGANRLPEDWYPGVCIRLGNTLGSGRKPTAIVHSSPGLAWRHTGLPPAEHKFWISQVAANGGGIWHSLTGIPDSIPDKRILRTVAEHNALRKKAEPEMEGAVSAAEIALVWTGSAGEGWGEALSRSQVPFDVVQPWDAVHGDVSRYHTLILPADFPWTPEAEARLRSFTEAGGSVLAEGTLPQDDAAAYDLFGIADFCGESEPLQASYWRFETDGPVRRGFEDTPLIEFHGSMSYVTPAAGTQVLATLVPPFAPPDGVGAPAERAMLPVSQTDIPLCTLRSSGKGKAVYLPFALNKLIKRYRLPEHFMLVQNLLDLLSDGKQRLTLDAPTGVQVTLFQKENGYLLHLLNGVGKRPLGETIPVSVRAKLRLQPGQTVLSAERILTGKPIQWQSEENAVCLELQDLDTWEVIGISFSQ